MVRTDKLTRRLARAATNWAQEARIPVHRAVVAALTALIQDQFASEYKYTATERSDTAFASDQ